jgi:WD40 repeat protein
MMKRFVAFRLFIFLPLILLFVNGYGQHAKIGFDPSGKLLLSSSSNTSTLWELDSGKVYRNWDKDGYAQFNHNGDLVATCHNNRTINFWSVETGKLTNSIRTNSGFISTFKLCPYGKWLVIIYANYVIEVWELHTGKLKHTFTAYSNFLNKYNHRNLELKLYFNRQGKVILETYNRVFDLSLEDWGESMRYYSIWDVLQNSEFKRVYNYSISPNGEWLYEEVEDVVVFNKQYKGDTVYSTNTGEIVYKLSSERLIGWSNDNLFALTTRKEVYYDYDTLKVVDLSTQKDKFSLDKNKYESYTIAEFNSKNTILIAANRDGSIKAYDLKSGEIINSLNGSFKKIKELVPSNNGKYTIVTVDYPELWSIETGNLLKRFETSTPDKTVNAFFSPDSKWVVTVEDGVLVKIWQANTGMLKHTLGL